MAEYKISINQLATFSKVSEARKRTIVKQQKNPPAILVGRYAMAKARIKKAIGSGGNIIPVLQGIEELKQRNPDTPWKKNDKTVSIDAMERYIKMTLPSILKEHKYEIVAKQKVRSFFVSSVEILVSPDLIIKVLIDGNWFLGGLKLHVSKSELFDREQSKYVSTCIYQYLDLVFEDDEIIVLPELCFSVDVFADSIISAPKKIEKTLEEIETMCLEIKKIWPNV
jgi:hypothetical protein